MQAIPHYKLEIKHLMYSVS